MLGIASLGMPKAWSIISELVGEPVAREVSPLGSHQTAKSACHLRARCTKGSRCQGFKGGWRINKDQKYPEYFRSNRSIFTLPILA